MLKNLKLWFKEQWFAHFPPDYPGKNKPYKIIQKDRIKYIGDEGKIVVPKTIKTSWRLYEKHSAWWSLWLVHYWVCISKAVSRRELEFWKQTYKLDIKDIEFKTYVYE